jgi:hypothetical protein
MPPMRVKIVVSLGKVHCNDKLRDRKLLPRLKIILPSSELLRGVRCFETDVSGLCIRPETSVSKPLTQRYNPEDGRINIVNCYNNILKAFAAIIKLVFYFFIHLKVKLFVYFFVCLSVCLSVIARFIHLIMNKNLSLSFICRSVIFDR